MVDDWLTHRDAGHDVLMLATGRATVGWPAPTAARGDIARRSRTCRAPDDGHSIALAVGDEVILRRIYATRDRAWIDGIGRRRGHALAVDQAPNTDVKLGQVLRLRSPARDAARDQPVDRPSARDAGHYCPRMTADVRGSLTPSYDQR